MHGELPEHFNLASHFLDAPAALHPERAAIIGAGTMGIGITINFLNAEGSVCGSLLPTGNHSDMVCGVEVTCIDQGMPVVIVRAADVGFSGSESCVEIEAATDLLRKIEAIRLEAALRMGMGDVS